jgi:uncharacterized protein (DUF1778 family)
MYAACDRARLELSLRLRAAEEEAAGAAAELSGERERAAALDAALAEATEQILGLQATVDRLRGELCIRIISIIMLC